MKPAPIDYDTVREMLRTATPDRVLRFIGKSHPADIALLFKGLDSAEVRQLFDVLFSSRRAAKTLKELPPELLPDILALIDDEKVGRLIVRADPDDAVTFIDSLPEDRRERVLALLDPERRAAVREIINYPDGTVGRLMTTDFMALPPDATAQGAIDKIRERGELESFFYLYVVEKDGKLVGVVPIRNLVIAPPMRKLRDMMIPDPIKADVFMDQEDAARIVSKYELLALPIVDEGGRLEGIITVDDVIDIIKEESTEDMYKMVGLAEEDRVFTPVSRSVRMRLPWTILNLLTASLAASIVGLFEGTLHEIVALVTFMPVVAGVGGNGATQTATVIIRAIALGELEFSSAWKAIVKQVSVNICIAVAAGAMIAVAAGLWKGNPYLGLILAGAMLLNLGLMAGFAGAVIPLLLKALKLDPALGSGIIVTGLTDAFGFLSFLGLATMFRSYLI
ncbi:MAG TPA: magnesium transporter [Candidatus Limnocylindrales bacterium]|jgi:magnesium transporter|nr:magnesium transporter [Candidatus Limnocylindrales bacterium]